MTAKPHDTGDDSARDVAATKRKKAPELELAVEQTLCDWFADHPLLCDERRHFKKPSMNMRGNNV